MDTGQPPPLFFIHLHKAAGTSFLQAAADHGLLRGATQPADDGWPAGADEACDQQPAKQRASMSKRCCLWREAARTRGIAICEPGHWLNRTQPSVCAFGFDPRTDLCHGVLQYVCLVREPEARLLSHMCEHSLSVPAVLAALDPISPEQQARCEVREPSPSCKRPATSQSSTTWPAGPGVDNYLVRSLGGRSAWTAPSGQINESHLAAAMKTVRDLDVVLRLEHLQSDLAQLTLLSPEMRSWTALPHVHAHACRTRRYVRKATASRNVSDLVADRAARLSAAELVRSEFSHAEWQHVVHANRFDARLYAWAAKLAAERTLTAAAGTRSTRPPYLSR